MNNKVMWSRTHDKIDKEKNKQHKVMCSRTLSRKYE